jgi:ADP-L-glycero-D-manno-heptose 6-epimerase
LEQYPKILVQGFRYFNVWGKYEDHKADQASPYSKFTQQALTEGEIRLFENSNRYYRDFVPVETVIDVHKQFLKIKKSGIWNLGTGIPTSFQSIAEEISNKYNVPIRYISMPQNLKSQYQVYTCADLTKLKNTLNEKSSS